MPTVNIYCRNQEKTAFNDEFIKSLKAYISEKLTCENIRLTPEEVSIRIISINKKSGSGMLGDMEIEILAHAFPERVTKQDDICREVALFCKEKIPKIGEVKVWLQLSELGHSW
jgi:hypothetical protein